jgi:hypothetical protein
MWNSSMELLGTIHDAHRRLQTKETDALTAHAEARLLNAAAKVMSISLDHARLTNRLTDGSAVLPAMLLGKDDGDAIEITHAPERAELSEASVS